MKGISHVLCLFSNKISKMVHSFMRDRRMNAYGVSLKSHFNSDIGLTDTTKSSPFTQNFVTISSYSFEDGLKKGFSKIERQVLVPD